ncbi:MAG TPA: CHRD domain-containing protein [Candidatus Eisenbacteria bacterium]
MRKALGLMSALAVLLFLTQGTSFAAGAKTTFRATLTGTEEVPARTTQANGTATFTLNKAGTEIKYRLIVHNIENITEAHIHMGATGANGPAVAILFGPVAPGGGKKNGLLAAGMIKASDLIGTLAGKTIGDLVAEIRAGNTYVNVHTNDGVAEANRGAGDFPDGEIRGQIR